MEGDQVGRNRASLRRNVLTRLLGARLLLTRDAVEEISKGGIILPKIGDSTPPLMCTVDMVGEGWPESEPVSPGDKVIVSPWAGKINGSYEFDDDQLIVNDYEVLAVLEREDQGQAYTA